MSKAAAGIAPRPVKNPSIAGAGVYTHSGEFTHQALDVALKGRGQSFHFARTYHSGSCRQIGLLGRGWTFLYEKRLEMHGAAIVYNDGGTIYTALDRLYTTLEKSGTKMVMRHRHGVTHSFELPEKGGRLLTIEDRHGNALRFTYKPKAILVTDPLGRTITLSVSKGRIVALEDHTKRQWRYRYDRNDCLVQVIQPPASGKGKGPTIQYSYDAAGRLTGITDPKGQNYLQNTYDQQERVQQQTHGTGKFVFAYQSTGKANAGFPLYHTTVTQKNGSKITFRHDADGHAIERTHEVAADSLSQQERGGAKAKILPLTVTSAFNDNGELVRRVYPDGDSIEWSYDSENKNPLAHGNLLVVTRHAAPHAGKTVQPLVTAYTYSPKHQFCTSITSPLGEATKFAYDAKGNLLHKSYPKVTVQQVAQEKQGKQGKGGKHSIRHLQLAESYAYNDAGQLIQCVDTRGAVTLLRYYPEATPQGGKQKGVYARGTAGGGYLATVVQDAKSPDRHLKSKAVQRTITLKYDALGNVTAVVDGKGRPTRFEYDAHNRVVTVTSRGPEKYTVTLRYDANGNRVEMTSSFDRFDMHTSGRSIVQKSSTINQLLEHDILNRVVRRRVKGDDHELVHSYVRDTSENIVKEIAPMGNVTERLFDERNLLVKVTQGAGTPEQWVASHRYTRNGRRSATTDGLGGLTHYHYDAFGRFVGSTNAGGVSHTRTLNGVGDVTHVAVTDTTQSAALRTVDYHYDELRRCVRIDRSWCDATSGASLGKSSWDDTAATVSTVMEYGEGPSPSQLWIEPGDTIAFQYDGVNQLTDVRDALSERVTLAYDENGNVVEIDHRGPNVASGIQRFHQVILQEFDALDRLTTRTVNGEPPESFSYNALNALVESRDRAANATQYLHDAFGRKIGQAVHAVATGAAPSSGQLLARRVAYDDNHRIVSRTNPAGSQIQYQYDALNHRTGVRYPDGHMQTFQHDANGNVIRTTRPDGTVIVKEYDALDRLVRRQSYAPNGQANQDAEQFQYNGLGRIISAANGYGTITRRFDSLSRLLEETSSGRTVRRTYDSAGNCVALTYPSGKVVKNVYGKFGQLLQVLDGSGVSFAQYTYRSRGQVSGQRIGAAIQASLSYTACQNRLQEIVYTHVDTDAILEGSQYAYDLNCNWTQETHLAVGKRYGDRYTYDTANRLTGVQYGVKNLRKGDSPFAHEVSYLLTPTGAWSHKRVLDSEANTVADLQGTTDQRGVYLSLGTRRFTNDVNGNRVGEVDTADTQYLQKQHSYDSRNRLIRAVALSASGGAGRTVDYVYDALGRHALKRVTDVSGVSETTRVWNGEQLIEEWDGAHVARRFVHGAGSPLWMGHQDAKGTETGFYYLFNGRGFVTALAGDNGDVAERYGYDAFGQPSMSDGETTSTGEAPVLLASSLGNPFFAGRQLWDGDAEAFLSRGVAYEPSTDQFLQGLLQLSHPTGPHYETLSFSKCLAEVTATGTIVGAIAGGVISTIPSAGLATGAGIWGGAQVGTVVGGVIGAFACPDGPPTPAAPAKPDNSGLQGVGESGMGGGFGGGPSASSGTGALGGGIPFMGFTDDNNTGTGQPGPTSSPTGTVEVLPGDFSYDNNGNVFFNSPDGMSGVLHQDGTYEIFDKDGNVVEYGNLTVSEPNQSIDNSPNSSVDDGTTQQSNDGTDTNNGTDSTDGTDDGGVDGGTDGGIDGGDGGTGSGCFVAETAVRVTDGVSRPIAHVDVGNFVLARDERTGAMASHRVTKRWVHHVPRTLLVRLANDEQIETTREHRFHVKERGFVAAGSLVVGDELSVYGEDTVRIAAIEPKWEPATVYNLEVERYHTYFVGDSGVWVHNRKTNEETDGDLPGGDDAD